MTPSKKGKATCIKIERKQKLDFGNDEGQHYHVAGGEHTGLVINKETQGRTLKGDWPRGYKTFLMLNSI